MKFYNGGSNWLRALIFLWLKVIIDVYKTCLTTSCLQTSNCKIPLVASKTPSNYSKICLSG